MFCIKTIKTKNANTSCNNNIWIKHLKSWHENLNITSFLKQILSSKSYNTSWRLLIYQNLSAGWTTTNLSVTLFSTLNSYKVWLSNCLYPDGKRSLTRLWVLFSDFISSRCTFIELVAEYRRTNILNMKEKSDTYFFFSFI